MEQEQISEELKRGATAGTLGINNITKKKRNFSLVLFDVNLLFILLPIFKQSGSHKTFKRASKTARHLLYFSSSLEIRI